MKVLDWSQRYKESEDFITLYPNAPVKGVGTIITIKGKDERTRYLLGLRADTNDWTLPGGGIEPNETLFIAAQRETREEFGLFFSLSKFTFTGIAYAPINTKKHTDTKDGITVHCHVDIPYKESRALSNIKLEKDKILDYGFFTKEDLLGLDIYAASAYTLATFFNMAR